MRFPAYFWGEILKKLLQFLFQSGMLYPTKAKLGYILTLERLLRLRARLCFFLAIFFIYLLIIYPACPARDEKSDDPPARVVAFSFCPQLPAGAFRESSAEKFVCFNLPFLLDKPQRACYFKFRQLAKPNHLRGFAPQVFLCAQC